MAYGRYNRKRRMVAVKPKTTPRKYTRNRKKYSKAPKITFAQKVKAIISRNVENKFTDTLIYFNPVSYVTSTGYTFFTWSPGQNTASNRLFNLAIGAKEGQRIGNSIKLKRWIIKGIIQPTGLEGTGQDIIAQMKNGLLGYVDIYFGRYLKNTSPVVNTLSGLYQNGASTTTPTCKSTDMLNPLNKDNYKVYYHKRFKMGQAYDPIIGSTPTISGANNDFKLSQTFGFDVCKYILKDKHLKFNDGGITSPYEPPENIDITNLTLWATFTPASGQATFDNSDPDVLKCKTLYGLDCLTYAEYEDA